MPERSPKSTHDLATIQALVALGRFRVVESAREYTRFELDLADVRKVVSRLTTANAYKTMPSIKSPGAMQDVYKIQYREIPLYVKLDLIRHSRTGEPQLVLVLSFKKDESP